MKGYDAQIGNLFFQMKASYERLWAQIVNLVFVMKVFEQRILCKTFVCYVT